MESASTRDRVAHHSHLWVLPVAGAGALALGSLTLVHGLRVDLIRYLPIASILVGGAALVGAYASHPWHRRGTRATGPSSAAGALPVAVPADHGASVLEGPEVGPSSGLGRAAVHAVAHVGDELWRRWATPRSSSLGAQLVGPVPVTAYAAPPEGATNPVSDRDRDIVFLPEPGEVVPSDRPSAVTVRAPAARFRAGDPFVSLSKPAAGGTDASRMVPFTEEDLDRMFPLDPSASALGPSTLTARASSPPRPTTAAVARPVPMVPLGEAGPLSSGPVGLLPTLDEYDHATNLADLGPFDPGAGRLPSGLPGRSDPRPANDGPPNAVARLCHGCARRLSDFRTWAECAGCRKPLCRLCLTLSFVSGTMGSCSDCSGVHTGSGS
jgi:hypothetical protein